MRSLLARPSLRLYAGLLCLLPAAGAAQDALYEQRQAYRRAVDLVYAGHITSALKIQKEALAGYVLAPYVTYHRNRLRLSRLTPEEVASFRQAHPDIPGAQRIYWQWLKSQAERGRWRTFLAHYEASDDPEHQCLQLRALYNTGTKKAALDGVRAIWTVGESQPKACDPMFQIWQRERLTDEMAWQRLRLAIQGNQRLLARYMARFFSPSHKAWAQAYYNVHVDPDRIKASNRYRTDNALSREVIGHGLRRLAGRDAEAARDLWAQYAASHQFTPSERQSIDEPVEVALADAGLLEKAPYPEASPEAAIGFADAYIKRANWPLLRAWIERTPKETRFEMKWQYWLARAEDQTHAHSDQARLAFQSLAEKRNYYGFLAAHRIGAPVRMNDASKRLSAQERQRALDIPAVARMVELFAHGDETNARRELFSVLPRLTPEERRSAVYMVQDIGLTALAITAAFRGELFDDLKLRFPVLHLPLFERASHRTNVALPVLLAFARQESAFRADARSVANARGILQMLPSTARVAARRAGLPLPTANDLYDPAKNIPLASSHIAWLMRRYDQALPFVAAAYNAGEHRADRWMREYAGAPLDAWIEAIPFRETRNYVKNLVAFSQVYAHLFDRPVPILPDIDAVTPN